MNALPAKSFFKFQELTAITGVKPYVLRFWETEFSEMIPTTSDDGQKLYSRENVESIMKVKELLFDHKLSVPEAKVVLGQPERLADLLARKSKIQENTHQQQANQEQMSQAASQVRARATLELALTQLRSIKQKYQW